MFELCPGMGGGVSLVGVSEGERRELMSMVIYFVARNGAQGQLLRAMVLGIGCSGECERMDGSRSS